MRHSIGTNSSYPLVSVIIPTYNRRGLVVRAIRSAFAQTYKNIEVIVIDDGSTDGTGDIINRLPFPLTYYYQPNRGLAAARNVAIYRSHGDLVALLDSDESWKETKLERCVRYLQSHPRVDIVYTPTLTVDRESRPMKGHDKICREGYLLDDLFENIFVHDSAVVLRRYVWENVGGFDESLPVCVGHDFFLRAAVDHIYGLISEPLNVRIWMNDSLTRGDRVRGQKFKIEMLTRFYKEHPGSAKLSPDRARRSLGKAFYSAGKICLRGGDLQSAVEFLHEATRYCPKWAKARLFYLWALGQPKLRRAA